MKNAIRKTGRILPVVVAALAVGSGARPPEALEISLEQNRAERGNIGYVDIQKVFRLFPQTHKAKQSYGEIVRQAEEQVNLKKAELMALRAEIAKIKLERDILSKSPIPAAPDSPPAGPEPLTPSLSTGTPSQAPVSVSTPSAPVPDAAPAHEGGVPASTAAVAAAGGEAGAVPESPLAEGATSQRTPLFEFDHLPGMSPPAESGSPETSAAPPEEDRPRQASEEPVARSTEPLVIDIPGVTHDPIVIEPSSGKDPDAARAAGPQPATAEPGTPAQEPVPPAEAAGGAAAAEETPVGPEERLARLDAEIAAKRGLLAEKETAFREYQLGVEKNLIEIEDRRAEILLGKIYQALRDVARENGVSVVVDKNQILFGQDSVDLTQKVIDKLEGLSL
ncbi:MAG: OmpH family outer membrane protein [Elusimicrobiota bacterium]